MKKKSLLFALIAVIGCMPLHAADSLSAVLPLLEAQTRTAAQNHQVLNLFATSKDASTIFASGASLVRIPPAKSYEAKLFNIILKNDNMLKKVFAAVIIVAMGGEHHELSPLLKDATASEDHALRAYAAAAYTILNPDQTDYKEDIINLYIYDSAFAQRAMNLISADENQTFKYLKSAAKSSNAQVRGAVAAWLGDLQTKNAAKQLLKMAKGELSQEVINAIAMSLAKNEQWTLQETAKGLKTRYTHQSATAYALALGFMTGNAVEPIKQALLSQDINQRINAARAAAYMAAVLASPQADQYTLDKDFDITLLKGLIPTLSAMTKHDESSVKVYADNALKQISKLM
ncbi:hypothetical protein [Candidatus Avelusimicrobium sp.]